MQKGEQKGEQIGMQKGEQIGMQKGEQKGEQIGMQKGEQIGMQKGEQIGIQKGEQIGMQKGVYLSALKLMENGMSPTDISCMLTITPEEMEYLTKLHQRFGDNAHLHLDDAE